MNYGGLFYHLLEQDILVHQSSSQHHGVMVMDVIISCAVYQQEHLVTKVTHHLRGVRFLIPFVVAARIHMWRPHITLSVHRV